MRLGPSHRACAPDWQGHMNSGAGASRLIDVLVKDGRGLGPLFLRNANQPISAEQHGGM